jgi:hypothetical protein
MEITAQITATGNKITVNKDLGNNLQEMIGLFGEDTVYNNAVDSMVITTQSMIRRLGSPAKDGSIKSAEEIQAAVDAQKYVGGGPRGTKKDPMEAFLAKFETMSPEKQKEMLQNLKAKLAAKAA